MDMAQILKGVISSAIYGLLGIILMGIGFWIINLVTPFSVKKEIETDQNTSLGIIIAGVIIGISIIIASAIIDINVTVSPGQGKVQQKTEQKK